MAEIKERPILFSGEMVKAILEGRKTQTRRVMKPQPPEIGLFDDHLWLCSKKGVWANGHGHQLKCPYGQTGDTLWVRETHYPLDNKGAALYRADGQCEVAKWTPSIFMFRKYSRINLKISDVRVERLQDISEEDAKTEGLIREISAVSTFWNGLRNPILAYRFLWEKINGRDSWDKNPWVWVIEFGRI